MNLLPKKLFKSQLAKKGALVLATSALLASKLALATVWWPEVKPVSPELTVYKDFDDKNLYYYVPKGAEIASTQNGAPMISHGLFFDRLNPAQSVTQYHLTLKPILNDEAVKKAEAELQKLYGAQARLVPLSITTVTFDATQNLPQTGESISAPFNVQVPSWTGDLHSFHQQFSVIMKGNLYRAEPAMSRFLMNPAGNAFVGTMHYGFRGAQIPFKGYAKLNIHQFVSKLKTHLHARYGFWAKVDIAAAIDKIKDDQSVFVDIVKDKGYESEVWKSLVNKLIEQAFVPAPTAPNAPSGDTSKAVFGFSVAYSQVTVDKVVTIDLKETIVSDHSGDLDITGGGVPQAQLDQNIKYLCDIWAKFDKKSGKCESVCDEGTEYWNPAQKACSPAFGGGAGPQ